MAGQPTTKNNPVIYCDMFSRYVMFFTFNSEVFAAIYLQFALVYFMVSHSAKPGLNLRSVGFR